MKNWAFCDTKFGGSGILHIVIYIISVPHAWGKVGGMGGFLAIAPQSGLYYTSEVGCIT